MRGDSKDKSWHFEEHKVLEGVERRTKRQGENAPGTEEEFSMDYMLLETTRQFPLVSQWSTQLRPTRAYSRSFGFWAGSDPDLSDYN